MINLNGFKKKLLASIVTVFAISSAYASDDVLSHAQISSQIFNSVKQNNNWKQAFLTAKHAQVVFMNISPITNPNNEIGMETHSFDQIIFVVEGSAKVILNGKVTKVKSGDMIFVPEGIEHNVVNLDAKKPLKILSVYSSTDIPANANYKKKSDALND